MRFFEYGKPDGAPLVFLLGTPHTGDSVSDLSDTALQSGVRLICTERPWYSDAGIDPSFEVCSAAVVQYLNEQGIQHACSIGGSGGGPFALHLATNNRDVFRACYLLASMGTPEVFVDEVASVHTRLLLDLFKTKSYGQAIDQLGAWGMSPKLAHGVWGDFQVLLGSWSSIEYGAELPVLIHHGESDDNAPMESVVALASHLKNAEFRISPFASHLGLANDQEFTVFKTIFAEVSERFAAAR